jgi:hypothetical protein
MKAVVYLMLLVLLAASASAEVLRDMPKEALAGSDINISFTVISAPGERFLIGEKLPEGATLLTWQVEGAQEGGEFAFRRDGQSLIWEFNATSAAPVITYTVRLPSEGTPVFDAVYAVSTRTHGRLTNEVKLLPVPVAAPIAPALEQPAPSRAPQVIFGIVGSIILLSIGIVYVVETSSRRKRRQVPFGYYTVQFVKTVMGFTSDAVESVQATMQAAVQRSVPSPAIQVQPMVQSVEMQVEPIVVFEEPILAQELPKIEPSHNHELWARPIFN